MAAHPRQEILLGNEGIKLIFWSLNSKGLHNEIEVVVLHATHIEHRIHSTYTQNRIGLKNVQ